MRLKQELAWTMDDEDASALVDATLLPVENTRRHLGESD